MLELLKDLYAHQAWADAAHWKALRAHGPALADADLKGRLFHIHAVQQVWLGRWQGLPMPFPKVEDYPDLEDLYHFAKACHVALRTYLERLGEGDLAMPITYRNLAGEAFTQPLGDLMLHLPMHSQYHRGQSATRMVALGAHMPSTDLVTWQRAGRPVPLWA
ncbi:MAG: DinB family protein [Holophagaceae bacterium]|nr:DinB family protein [Holophagaceae bacterium]